MKYVKIIAVLLVISLAGCNGCNKSRQKPDVSNININLNILRFDQDLLAIETNEFEAWKRMMTGKYGEFYAFYVSNFIIGPRPAGDTANIEQQAIRKFLADKYIKTIQDSINSRFNSMNDVQADLTQAFKYINYYLPDFKTPDVITINSAYGAGVSPYGNKQMVVGLDMFLGTDNHDYDSAGVYDYLRHKMRREYIVRYAVEAVYENKYAPVEAADQPLIEAMIDRGKRIYFLSLALPDAPDSLVLGYTQNQTDWCNKNELSIWQFLNDKDLLYKANAMEKMRYLGEGPTTTGMPAEAPGSIANFIGLQIIRKFVEETGNSIPVQDLLLKYDARAILAKAKYRPGK